jgi:hypothetical protein
MEKNRYTLVIPEGWTKKEYIQSFHDGDMPEEEHTSFWDKKIKVDPVTGTIIEIFSELFFGFIKCFLFFLEEYPKALAKVREEERARQKK